MIIVIYNYVGIALCVLAVFGGWLVKFSAWALGFSESFENLGFLGGACAVAVLLDLACRSTGIINSSPRGMLRFVAPSTGGQIFFVPIWALASCLLGYQIIRMLI
jgi:hypothetical protein